jgi:hypothetical protein
MGFDEWRSHRGSFIRNKLDPQVNLIVVQEGLDEMSLVLNIFFPVLQAFVVLCGIDIAFEHIMN